MYIRVVLAVAAMAVAAPGSAQTPVRQTSPHNVVIFVADGLRSRVVNDVTAPNFAALARQGVTLVNSHSLFPTFTMANASAIATGHYLGDTGVFSNTLYVAHPMSNAAGSPTAFIENDAVLGDLDAHFAGNFLNEDTILKLARDKGYSTAAVGKHGPTLLFDHTERTGLQTIIVDDITGTAQGIPLSAEMGERLKAAGLAMATPPRGANGIAGNVTTPGTKSANVVQQDYFAAVATRAVLPLFATRGKPFLLVFWSRDPDGTQHNQGDSFLTLRPGINGQAALAAIRNADDDLGRIRAALAELGLAEATDIIVTADHGFATISKESITSPAAQARHPDAPAGHLPRGFLAFDLAKMLGMPLIDPDNNFALVRDGAHSRNGNGLIGGEKDHPKLVVAANSGSDLIYIPDGDKALASQVVAALLTQDYVSGIFVDERIGRFPGALSLPTSISTVPLGRQGQPWSSIFARSIQSAVNRYAVPSSLPMQRSSKVRARTAPSAALKPGTSWRSPVPISNRGSSIPRPPATPMSAALSRRSWAWISPTRVRLSAVSCARPCPAA